MIDKKKARAVFNEILKMAIAKGGLKYPFEYEHEGVSYQICQDLYRVCVINKTFTSEEFETLPRAFKEQPEYDPKPLKDWFDKALRISEPIPKEQIRLKDLRRAKREASHTDVLNKVVEVTPSVSVVNYKEENRKDVNQFFILKSSKNVVAVPARQLIQLMNMVEDAEVRVPESLFLIYVGNSEAHCMVAPMGKKFWDTINKGASRENENSDGDKA